MLYLKGADFFYHLHKHWTDALLLCITSRVQLRATAGLSVGKNYHFKCYVHRPASRAFWNNEDERYTNAEICRHQQQCKYILVTFQRSSFTISVFHSSIGPSASVFSFQQKSQFTCDRLTRLFGKIHYKITFVIPWCSACSRGAFGSCSHLLSCCGLRAVC